MKQIGSTLPVEVVELIINHHLSSLQTPALYINALKRISLVCLHFLELMRRIKFKTLKFHNDGIILCMSFESTEFERPLHLHHRTPDTNQRFPQHILRYVKRVIISQSEKAYMSFNKWMKGPMYLEMLEFDGKRYMPGPNLLNTECIAELENISFSSGIYLSPLINHAASLFDGLKSVEIKCVNPNDYLRLSRLSALKATTMLKIRSRGRLGTWSIMNPVHELRIEISDVDKLDCYKSYSDTLTKLNIENQHANKDEFDIDAFLSGATKLQDLTITKYKFSRSPLLATFQVIKNLRDLRMVTFSTRYMQLITFRIHRQKLESIEIILDNYTAVENSLDWLIEELMDLTTFTLNDTFVRCLFEVAGPVQLKFMIRGKIARTREEYECGLKLPSFDKN